MLDRENETEEMMQQGENIEAHRAGRKSGKGFWSGVICGMLFITLVFLGAYAGRMAYELYQIRSTETAAETEDAEKESIVNAETLQKMRTIEEVINTYFYGDEVTTQEMQDGVYKGMMEALGDPYSEYYSEEELEEVMDSNQGVSYGIGAYISLDTVTNRAMISGVIEDTPAQAAGLREGDIIYEVDGTSTQDMSITQVVSMVKGREGTTVNLTIYREGEADYLHVDIVREKQIETTTVDSGILEGDGNIGYLRIREFDGVTVDQYAEAMAELKEYGMEGLILDLRSNPGGDLNAVVEIARKILPEGLVVYTEDNTGSRKEYTCDGQNELQIPLVVLVNGYSASASEILAGAIQDYGKGTLIGTTTYGKGIVQRIHRLDDGTALKLTVSAYFTPLGRNIHGVGIEPDIEVELDYDAYEADGTDSQLEKAIEVLTEKME